MLLQLFVDNTRPAMRLWIFCISTTSIKTWRSGAYFTFLPLHLSEPLRRHKVVVYFLWLVDFRFVCFCVSRLVALFLKSTVSFTTGGGGGGTRVIFGWVCAARDSKLAPRSEKKFPLNLYPVLQMGQYFIPRSRIRPKVDTSVLGNSLLVNALNRIFKSNLSLNNVKWLLIKLELSCVRNIIPCSRKRLWNRYPVLTL